jgi:hypothetical protein
MHNKRRSVRRVCERYCERVCKELAAALEIWEGTMTKALLVVALITSILARNCWAITSEGRFTILGEGTTSCGSWLQQRKSQLWLNEAAWVLGYLTAYNKLVWKGGSNIAAGTDADGIEAWIDTYCAAHPLDTINSAVEALTTELLRRRSR